MSYILILSIVTGYGAVNTQRVTGFTDYESCAQYAVAWGETQPLNPGERIKWECERK